MTREEMQSKAQRMREEGATYREIAEAFSASITTIYRWLNPERTRPYRNGRACNPQRARDYDRAYREAHKAECPQCGTKMKPESGLCISCHEDRRDARARKIEKWWEEGLTGPEICTRLGWTKEHLAVEMHRMREMGYSLPYRYRLSEPRFPEQVAA